MRYIFLYLIFFFFSFFTSFISKAKDTLKLEYPYVHYTTKNGLPSNESYCILQDTKGYIWIGTDRGLVRYDGYEFKTYTSFDGLLNNVILDVFEDHSGKIWYSTLNGKVGYVDVDLTTLGSYKYQNKIDSILKIVDRSEAFFNKLSFDKFGNIILLNHIHGYIKINKDGTSEHSLDRFQKLITHIKPLDGNLIYKHGTRDNYNVESEVYFNDSLIYSGKRSGYYIASNPQLVEVKDTFIIYDNRYFLKLSKGGKVYKDKKLHYKTQVFKFNDQFLFNVLDDLDNEIQGSVYVSNNPWVGAQKSKILEGVYVSRVLQDLKGGLWISTSRSGLYYFPDLNHLVSNLDLDINGIIPVKENNIVFNTKRYTNYLYNIKDNTISLIDSLLLKDIEFNKLYSNHFDNFENIKIHGAKRLELSDGKNPKKEHEFCIQGIQKINEDHYCYWVPNYLYEINGNDFKVNWSPKLNFKRLESYFNINDSLSLIGCHTGMFVQSNGVFRKILLGDKFNDEPRISNIIYIKECNMIICSVLGMGILILDDQFNIMHHLTTENGLLSNTVNHIYVDEKLEIWIGTNKGIMRLKIKGESIDLKNVFASSMTLKSPNIHQIFRIDNLLYIGSDHGITVVDVNKWEESQFDLIPLYITNIQISDSNYVLSHSLDLNYDDNNIKFKYLGISYNHHGRLNYRYRLIGLSEEWIYTKNLIATFLKVAPGNYTFELAVQNEFGNWISLKEPIHITINKPYWNTWWFVGGGILLVFCIIGGILYYYILNIKKEKAFVEQEQVLSEELNTSRQMALSAQLNPHFVFNSLNSIQNFILTKRTELSSDYLSMFSKLMRFVFENSKKLYVPLYDEIEAMRLYLELEQVRHHHKFNYEINKIGLELGGVFIPSLLVQPIIENAIWHGLLHKQEDNRLLEVKFSRNAEYLFIEIKDNGVGRNNSKPRPKFIKKQKSSGVELTKQRLSLLSQSTGLNTDFKVIDLFDDNNFPCGTCVRISIPVSLTI